MQRQAQSRAGVELSVPRSSPRTYKQFDESGAPATAPATTADRRPHQTCALTINIVARRLRLWLLAALCYVLGVVLDLRGCAVDESELGRLRLRRAPITLSGLSNGADMAIQFHVAHSQLVGGVCAFSGQPYRCAVTRFAGEPRVPLPMAE